MKMQKHSVALAALSIMSVVPSLEAAHVAAGVAPTELGNVLAFYNQIETETFPEFHFTTMGGLLTMSLMTTGPRAGQYQVAADVYYALALGTPNGSPAPSGAFIDLFVTSVIGPEGGALNFFESGAQTPTFTVGVGDAPDSLDFYNLSVAANAPDPFGHIHGRQWSFTQPGDYTVTFVLKDRSGQVGDSAPYTVSYSSVPEPGVATALLGGIAVLAFRRNRARR